ncbi:NEDD4 family-interacting protein 2 [Calliphora vicina]|uniref:NEDD4 family-interacting protein 2 n=1 Tax=Calliphora vicina TaxID=7373 RepID=UPI00325B4115
MPDNNQGPPEPELGPPKADFSAPPPYELTNSHVNLTQQSQMPLNQQNLQQAPTLTEIPMHHGKLPTYEEVQMEKSLNGELPPGFLTTHTLQPPPLAPPPNPLLANLRDPPGSNGGGASGLTFIAIDASEAENLTNSSDNNLLGTDIMFIMAFVVAFLFNWIGFLMLTCFCHTIAARYGALSGFGLSLAKWTLIVKHSTDLASHENSWLWWLIMAFGFLICVRALIQYVSIKRTWRLLSTSAQERLLFFY